MLRQLITVTLTGLFSVSLVVGQGGGNPIFLVQAYNCPGAIASRSLTGFRAAGVPGIVTTLHGVAGCRSIKAQSEGGPPLSRQVLVSRVSIDNDLATLDSLELANSYPTGYPLSGAPPVPYQNLSVDGYPEGLLHHLITTLQVRSPASVSLSNLLSRDLNDSLSERASPSPLLTILSIQGNLLPGHSGAPIFDQNHRVVAVANGGLKEGTVAISWAIPIAALQQLRPSAGSERLAALITHDSAALFSFAAAETAPPMGSGLAAAVANNDVQSAQRILRVSVPQDEKDGELYAAVRNGSAQVLGVLIENGADPATSGRGDTVLCYAVEKHSAGIVEVLARFPDRVRPNGLCSRGSGRVTPLQLALLDWWVDNVNTLDIVRALLSIRGLDANISGSEGTPLNLAALIGDPSLVSLLLTVKGIAKNQPDRSGYTPADTACIHNPGVLKLLLDAGAKGNTKSSKELKECAGR